MDMVLLDWTRMGKLYCLAGAVWEAGRLKIVRPLLHKFRDAPVRNVGWSPWLLDGHSRWEEFELIGPEPAPAEAPHMEDLWVRSLRPRRRSASRERRQAILTATMPAVGETLFGVHLTRSHGAAFLRSGTGLRSLATLAVPAAQITFQASCRDEATPDVRVVLHLPGLEDRLLPVKDHHLLCHAEQAGGNPRQQVEALNGMVRRMGEQVAVRLGLTRPFSPREDCGPGYCWLMADGFFSLADPQS